MQKYKKVFKGRAQQRKGGEVRKMKEVEYWEYWDAKREVAKGKEKPCSEL